jgi:hypothetical protein
VTEPLDRGTADDVASYDTAVPGAAPPDQGPNVSNYAAGVYGTIIAASVLAAGANETTGGVVALVVVTLIVYWLAEQYAFALAHSLAGHRADRAQLRHGLREGFPMVQASYLPVGVLIVAWAFGFDTNTAVNLALTACVIVLFVLGWRGAARRELLLRGRVMSSLIAGSFGVAVVLLKLLVTH